MKSATKRKIAVLAALSVLVIIRLAMLINFGLSGVGHSSTIEKPMRWLFLAHSLQFPILHLGNSWSVEWVFLLYFIDSAVWSVFIYFCAVLIYRFIQLISRFVSKSLAGESR
jgi:hypothetical protein